MLDKQNEEGTKNGCNAYDGVGIEEVVDGPVHHTTGNEKHIKNILFVNPSWEDILLFGTVL